MSEQNAYKTADSTYAAFRADTVTPSDSALIEHTRALWVGIGGNISVTMMNGVNVTFVGALGGTILPIQCLAVRATSTTATNILALY